jgi:hypothetical protein
MRTVLMLDDNFIGFGKIFECVCKIVDLCKSHLIIFQFGKRDRLAASWSDDNSECESIQKFYSTSNKV